MFGLKCREPQNKGIVGEFRQAVTVFRNAAEKLNQVDDDDLIEAAIYEHQAARLRVDYLARQARESGVTAEEVICFEI